MIGAFVAAILGNLGLVFVAIAIVVTIVRVGRSRRNAAASSPAEVLYAELVFYGIGLTFVWAATFHAFFADIAAPSIGWKPSPFEWELAWAEYGIALIAVMSRWQGYPLRLAATLVFCVFSFGAAAQHIEQIVCCRNYSPDNAGTILWVGDIAVPLVLFVLAIVTRPGLRSW